jgi:uncharacterized protein (DUF58 family)
MGSTFLNRNFFIVLALAILLFVLAYAMPILFRPAQMFLCLFVLLIAFDWYRLYKIRDLITFDRVVPLQLSLSDGEDIVYSVVNDSDLDIDSELYDELPRQFQNRSAVKIFGLEGGEKFDFAFSVRPYERGEYNFGNLHLIYATGPFYFTQRRITIDKAIQTRVVPSVKQMKQHELEVFSQTASLSGIRKIRSVGQNDEFEHIRPYVQGDNIKSINWKATSRTRELMVDQYQDSRHQEVYCILDKGRSMKMPFEGMTLLDYSINSILSLSNIILKKYDHAGLVSFSEVIGTTVKASAKKGQLEKISSALYKETTGFKESNFELLLHFTRQNLVRRSIWLFFTNFETPYDLHRQLPYLRLMNKRHLVVAIIFVNTTLIETSEMECATKSDIYLKTFAERAIIEKQRIKEELIRNGIQTILTKPKNLSVNVINKYLEIKARRLR